MKATKVYNSNKGRTARIRKRPIGQLPDHLRVELSNMDKGSVLRLKIASSMMLLGMGIVTNSLYR